MSSLRDYRVREFYVGKDQEQIREHRLKASLLNVLYLIDNYK
jgi:hypothetical protein